MYNFPSLGDGPQVISLDPVSVPPGYALTNSGRESGKGWTRLLRTPIGGGALLRQNFALLKSARSTPADGSQDQLSQSAPTPSTSAKPASSPSGDNSTAQSDKTNLNVPGTYEIAATDKVDAVAPGDVNIISPSANSVSMSPGVQIEARTALDWTVKLEVNGEQISDKNIGVRSLDHKNQVATFTFVGINLKPGANKIRCTAVGPDGAVGKSQEIMIMGRGPAKRLQVSSDRAAIEGGGSDSTVVRVKAFDE